MLGKEKEQQRAVSKRDALLTRSLDGELSVAENAEMEALLEENPELAAELEQHGRVCGLLRRELASELEAMDFTGFWEGVDAGIERLPVAEAADSRKIAEGSTGLFDRIRTWIEGVGWRPIAVGAMAVALLTSVVVTRSLLENDSQRVAHNDVFIENGSLFDASSDALTDADGAVVFTVDEIEVITTGVEVHKLAGEGNPEVHLIHAPEQATFIWVNDGEGRGDAAI